MNRYASEDVQRLSKEALEAFLQDPRYPHARDARVKALMIEAITSQRLDLYEDLGKVLYGAYENAYVAATRRLGPVLLDD